MESAVVRSGRRALALTVHPGDRFEAASAGDAATERAELLEAWWLYSHTGRAYAYSFSLYLPESIPVSSERLVIAQWRQLCEASHCKPDRPILAIRYVNSRIVITRNDEHGQEILYQGDKNVQGQWLDFRVVTNFDATAKGLIVMSLNGKNIVQYHGPTVFASTHGYPAHGFVYFKTGLYRDVLNRPPWTIYIDEYRKDQCASLGCN